MASSRARSQAALEARRSQIAELYVRELMTERAIAEQLGVSRGTVRHDLRVRHVPMRGSGPRRATALAIKARREQVADMYVTARMSEREIGAVLGVHHSTVHADLVTLSMSSDRARIVSR